MGSVQHTVVDPIAGAFGALSAAVGQVGNGITAAIYGQNSNYQAGQTVATLTYDKPPSPIATLTYDK
jgi:hypothetical protein